MHIYRSGGGGDGDCKTPGNLLYAIVIISVSITASGFLSRTSLFLFSMQAAKWKLVQRSRSLNGRPNLCLRCSGVQV